MQSERKIMKLKVYRKIKQKQKKSLLLVNNKKKNHINLYIKQKLFSLPLKRISIVKPANNVNVIKSMF